MVFLFVTSVTTVNFSRKEVHGNDRFQKRTSLPSCETTTVLLRYNNLPKESHIFYGNVTLIFLLYPII